jgi:hypothetical protein
MTQQTHKPLSPVDVCMQSKRPLAYAIVSRNEWDMNDDPIFIANNSSFLLLNQAYLHDTSYIFFSIYYSKSDASSNLILVQHTTVCYVVLTRFITH